MVQGRDPPLVQIYHGQTKEAITIEQIGTAETVAESLVE